MTLSDDARATLERMAAANGLTLSVAVEALVTSAWAVPELRKVGDARRLANAEYAARTNEVAARVMAAPKPKRGGSKKK